MTDDHDRETPPNDADWSYEGATGPAHWAALTPRFADCDGDAQSPIDLAGAQPDDDLEPLRISYPPISAEENTEGHHTSVAVPPEADGALTFEGQRYALQEFHFHTPSEHTVEGRSFDAEAHFVHEGDDGTPAVLAVLIEAGDAHPSMRQLFDGDAVDPERLLPEERSYYIYTGSLTTPPCTEGVRWVVLQEPVEWSRAQIERLEGDETNRPVQPLNGRTVAASR